MLAMHAHWSCSVPHSLLVCWSAICLTRTKPLAHEIAAIMAVLEFPPRLSFNSQVKTESRYGTKSSFFFFPLTVSLAVASAAMTLPRVVNDLLMFAPSLSLVP